MTDTINLCTTGVNGMHINVPGRIRIIIIIKRRMDVNGVYANGIQMTVRYLSFRLPVYVIKIGVANISVRTGDDVFAVVFLFD